MATKKESPPQISPEDVRAYLKKYGFKNFQELINFNVKHGMQKAIWFEDKAFVLESKTVKGFAHSPVKTQDLANLVKEKYKLFNKFIPKNLEKMVKGMCRVFNECIRSNQTNLQPELKENCLKYIEKENMYRTFVLSPKTGSAKSLTLKAYISLLKTESSIVVVKQVKDAIEYCEEINKWSKDPNYARCHYAINDEHLKNEVYVPQEELQDYRCIVITHSLFTQLKHTDRFDKIQYFNDKNRDLVCIDERIKVHNQYSLQYEECQQAELFIKEELKRAISNKLNKEVISKIDDLDYFIGVFNITLESILNFDVTKIDYISEQQWDFIYEDACPNINDLLETIEKYIGDHPYLETSLFGRTHEKLVQEQKNNLSKIVQSMFFIATHMSLVFKSGNKITLYSIDHYENNFLSQVILDATAHINPYYLFAARSIYKNLDHIEIKNYKRYDNLTFHIAQGYGQGRSTIYKNSEKDILHEVKRYLAIADEIINENDNLLILGHKKFINYLEKYSQKKNIFFTYWGKHIGHNNWAHCNKVMVIGWNYIPRVEHYLTLGAGNNGFRNTLDEIMFEHYKTGNIIFKYPKLITTIIKQQIADDLVQGISRGALRNTIDTDGNCPKTDIYIFHKKHEDATKIIKLVKDEFQGSKSEDWYPKDTIGTKVKKSKPQHTMDKIVQYVNEQLQTIDKISSAKVIEQLKISKTTFHRLVVTDDFTKLMDSSNLKYDYIDKKSKAFTQCTC